MTQPRPKILYLVHRVPYPPNRGDRIRSFHLLKSLAQRADVWLGFLTEDSPPRQTMETLDSLCQRVAAVQLGRRCRWGLAAWSLLSGRTATEGLFNSRQLRRTVRRWAEEVRFDAVVVFCSSMTQYLDVPGLAGVPVVVDLVDVDSQKWFDYAELGGGLKRFLFRLEGRRLRRLESGLADRAAAIAVVSEAEASLYRSFRPSDRVFAVPNGVDLEYFRPPLADASVASQQCVFVGALDYRANIDGVTWFCHEVWPEVKRRCPDATFAMVGSRPGPSVRRLARIAGVRLVGEVPDVRPYLAGSALAVVPLRVARGIQNKVLEALAMSKAVVVTPQALEGLAVEPGVSVQVAATPAAWIESAVGLLGSPEHRLRLGRAARRCVETRYDWPAQMAPLHRLIGLDQALPARPPAVSIPIAASTL
jgi:polysaccharide biosynthesis protein PslH